MKTMDTTASSLKPFVNIFIHESLKLYILLTDDDIGDGDTYILSELKEDGWEEFCTTQRGYKKAIRFMDSFYPDYQLFRYVHRQVTLKEIKPFIDRFHRHHLSPQGCNFAFAVKLGDDIIGAITAGRPVCRHFNGTNTLEITRVCVRPGYKNLCSYLYSNMKKVAKDLGYSRLITYTLETEPGISLMAAGFSRAYRSPGGSWNCTSRPRRTAANEVPKNMWQILL